LRTVKIASRVGIACQVYQRYEARNGAAAS
jgi:hypothetical protein